LAENRFSSELKKSAPNGIIPLTENACAVIWTFAQNTSICLRHPTAFYRLAENSRTRNNDLNKSGRQVMQFQFITKFRNKSVFGGTYGY